MRQIEVINQETIIDVTAETSSVEILVRDYDSELVERFALEAQEAAIEAEESADIATAQASIATAQATIATTQAGIATTQAGIATTQSGIATTKANEASASAASALASEQAADADRIAAQAAASTATTQAGIATTQAGIATTKAGEASDSAAAALASETDAETAASTATTQAGIATTQAGIATTQAGIATTQAGNALTSANNAAASAAAAAQVGTSTPLTGFSTGANSTILATDTILQGFNKTQGQINARVSGTIATDQVAFGTAANTIGGDNALQYNSTSGLFTLKQKSQFVGLRIENQTTGSSALTIDVPDLNYGRLAASELRFSLGGGTTFRSNSVFSDFTASSYFRFILGATEAARIIGGNLLLNTTTNAGFRLDVNGTARVQGNLNVSTGGVTLTGAQTIQTSTGNLTLATAAGNGNIAINPNGTGAVLINPNGNASVLVGLTTSRTNFNQSTPAKIQSEGISFDDCGYSTVRNSNSAGASSLKFGKTRGTANLSNTIVQNGDILGVIEFQGADGTNLIKGSEIRGFVSGTPTLNNMPAGLSFWVNGVINTTAQAMTLFPTANLLIQNGGTHTDAGFRLDVQGSTRFNGLSTIQGTTASDSGQLGAELLTTGTGDASWTGTSFATGYTHVAGSTTTLTSTLAGVVNTFYQITYTVTGRTAGSFTIGFGGFISGNLTATGAVGPQASTTGTLVITPTSDFNGTIVLSIRVITASSASVTFNNSSGAITNQIRISSINSNTFVGLNSGRNNTTGAANSFFGSSSGLNNTTGSSNSFFGSSSGLVNTTGANNSFFGSRNGENNTTGNNNCFFGSTAGFSNTTGNNNSFVGVNAGFSNSTGIQNSFFGQGSGLANTTGASNSFFGSRSGEGTTTGGSNSFFGVFAGFSNTTGGNNSFFGINSGFNNTTGVSNCFFGINAGRFIADGTTSLTIANDSVFIGANTRANANSQTNQIVIGQTAIGLGSNTTVLGNTSTTFGRWYGSLLLGTTTNAASSILTMESTTQGFLPPRMTTTQRNAIASPATGLVVYDNTLNKLSVFTGLVWETVTSL
jgi:hypothetical protein